jgi:hypothetical protein
MNSHTTQLDRELGLAPITGEASDCVCIAADEWQNMPTNCEMVVCCTPALEIFSQACSAYIDCELGSQDTRQLNPPIVSQSDIAAGGSLDELHLVTADGESVDAALPLLLDEIEAFIDYLRAEDCR